MANDTEFGIFDKVDDLVNMFALGNLFTNLDDGVFHAEVSSIDESVGIGDVAQDAFVYVYVFQDERVDAMIFRGVSTDDDVGGDILLYAATALDE